MDGDQGTFCTVNKRDASCGEQRCSLSLTEMLLVEIRNPPCCERCVPTAKQFVGVLPQSPPIPPPSQMRHPCYKEPCFAFFFPFFGPIFHLNSSSSHPSHVVICLMKLPGVFKMVKQHFHIRNHNQSYKATKIIPSTKTTP